MTVLPKTIETLDQLFAEAFGVTPPTRDRLPNPLSKWIDSATSKPAIPDPRATNHYDFQTSIRNATRVSHNLPKCNIIETSSDRQILIALPGISKKDIEIEIDNDMMTVSSHANSSTSDDSVKIVLHEIKSVSFTRSFTFTPKVYDYDNITATHVDGILTITVPKLKVVEKPKTTTKISIK
jgi:HSP20 family protein